MTHLKVGDKAPDFSGLDENGQAISLSDFAGQKLVLFFYPKDDTPGCTAEACDLRDHFGELKAAGYALVGVSPDDAKKHLKFKAKHDLPFPLIADTDQAVLKAYGAWGAKQMYGRTYDGVFRTTVVIDEGGSIQQVISKVDTKNHSQQILAGV